MKTLRVAVCALVVLFALAAHAEDVNWAYCVSAEVEREVEAAQNSEDHSSALSASLRQTYATLARGYRIYPERERIPANQYHIVLVPVGHQSEDVNGYVEKARRVLPVLEEAYQRVDVVFSTMETSAPMTIKRSSSGFGYVERTDQVEAVLMSLNERVRTDAVLLMVNSAEVLGLYDGRYSGALFSGAHDDFYYPAIHEVGHILSLTDGYRSIYEYPDKEDGKYYTIGSTELFFSVKQLRSDVRVAYQTLLPRIERAGTCREKFVYRFVDGPDVRNIMRERPLSDQEIRGLLKEGISFFSDLQIMVMNNFIERELSTSR